MGAPDNCLLKGEPIPRYMKDTGMFDTISIVSFSSIDTFQANLVWYRYIFQNYVYFLFYSWRIRAANNKKTLSLIASMRFFYHHYLIIVSCNCFSWRVIYAGATINVTCRTYPQRPQSERRRLGPQRERTDKGARDDGK